MFNIITTAIISSCSMGLVVFFITTISQRKTVEVITEKIIVTAVQKHTLSCETHDKVEKLKSGMIFLVTKSGGNPKDLGLL